VATNGRAAVPRRPLALLLIFGEADSGAIHPVRRAPGSPRRPVRCRQRTDDEHELAFETAASRFTRIQGTLADGSASSVDGSNRRGKPLPFRDDAHVDLARRRSRIRHRGCPNALLHLTAQTLGRRATRSRRGLYGQRESVRRFGTRRVRPTRDREDDQVDEWAQGPQDTTVSRSPRTSSERSTTFDGRGSLEASWVRLVSLSRSRMTAWPRSSPSLQVSR